MQQEIRALLSCTNHTPYSAAWAPLASPLGCFLRRFFSFTISSIYDMHLCV